MSRSSEKSLWDLALDQASEPKDESQSLEDASVFLCGSRNSGKTSIVLRFVDSEVSRDEAPKPTVALEYTFGRRSRGHNIAKDVGHIWELGGGTWLSKLMDIPLNPDTLMHTALFLVLDLSMPNELWFTLENLIQAARSRIETVIAEMKNSDPRIREKLKKRAWERVGEEHIDKNMIDPFLIPLVIVGSKYDIFQDMDSEKRKVICKTLRFVAHSHGAALQFFSTRQEQLVARMRALISHHLFATSPSKTLQTDHSKPLLIPAGTDSFQEIGSPPLSDKDLGRISAKTPIDLWKGAFTGYFPQQNTSNRSVTEDPAKDSQFTEAAIDSLRAQKDQELERYRRLSERRSHDTSTRAVLS